MVLWMIYKGYSYAHVMSRSFLPFFIVCWFWHWNYMDQVDFFKVFSLNHVFKKRVYLQVASAKRQADVMRNSDLPLACNPEQLGTLAYIQLLISTNIIRNPDPCDEYHRAYYTDPTYEVNPFIALVDLLARVVFQPMGFVGEKMGSFFDGVLST